MGKIRKSQNMLLFLGEASDRPLVDRYTAAAGPSFYLEPPANYEK